MPPTSEVRPSVGVAVDGLDDFVRGLRRADRDLANQMRAVFNDSTELVARIARARVPRRSGRLAASILPRSTQRQGRVKMGTPKRVPYAGWIEFGGTIVHQGPSHHHGLTVRKATTRLLERDVGGVARLRRRSVIAAGGMRLGRSTDRLAGSGAHLIHRPYRPDGRYLFPLADDVTVQRAVQSAMDAGVDRLMRDAGLA